MGSSGQTEDLCGNPDLPAPVVQCTTDPIIQALFDILPEAIMLVDRHGRILALNNPAAKRLCGSVEQLLGLSLSQVAQTQVRQKVETEAAWDNAAKAIDTGLTQRSLVRSKGNTFEIIYQPIRSGQGQTNMVLIVARHTNQAAKMAGKDYLQRLTPTERAILRLIIKGLPNKEIARQLHRSRRTIENHRMAIKAKMKAKTLADLIKKAAKYGLFLANASHAN